MTQTIADPASAIFAPAGGEPSTRWTIDRRVPAALIWTVGIALVAAIVFATTCYVEFGSMGERVTKLESSSAATAAATSDSIHKIEVNIAIITADIGFLTDHEHRAEDRGKP